MAKIINIITKKEQTHLQYPMKHAEWVARDLVKLTLDYEQNPIAPYGLLADLLVLLRCATGVSLHQIIVEERKARKKLA